MTGAYLRWLAPRLLALPLVAGVAACGGDADRAAPAEEGPVAEAPVAGEPGAVVDPTAAVADPAAADDPVVAPGPPPVRPAADAGRSRGAGGVYPAADPAAGEGTARPAERDGQGGVAAQPAAATEAILRATARRYEQVRSLRAAFSQQIRNPLLGRTTRSTGTLYQRQPDRFRMEFSDPEGDVIVSDGEYFWLYYPSVDARQVIRTPRGPQGLDLHAQFIGDPVRRFEATSHGQETVQGRAAHVLTLVPREALGYRSLKVWIDADDHMVRRFELTEENGSVRHFELHDVVVNPSLPDRLFQFTPPAGAQVIRR
jgi:outer membrane lipoprotein carrier protein